MNKISEIYLKEIKKFPPLTLEEEKKIIAKAKKGNKNAYNELMNRNLRFVVSVAKQYQNRGLPLEDLISEGNLGLLYAFTKFDPSRGLKFITYAVWWIRQYILKAIQANSEAIRLPANVILKLTNFNKHRAELEQSLGRNLTYEELVNYTDEEDLIDVIRYSYGMVYIDENRSDNNKDLSEILPDPGLVDNFDYMEDLKEELKQVFKDFTTREQEILKMYFGIENYRGYTLKEIGDVQNLTRERIRQIKVKSLEKLKNNPESDELREYMK